MVVDGLPLLGSEFLLTSAATQTSELGISLRHGLIGVSEMLVRTEMRGAN